MAAAGFVFSRRRRNWLLFLAGCCFFLQPHRASWLADYPNLRLTLLGLSGCLWLFGLAVWLFAEQPVKSWAGALKIIYFIAGVASVAAILGATYRLQVAYELR